MRILDAALLVFAVLAVMGGIGFAAIVRRGTGGVPEGFSLRRWCLGCAVISALLSLADFAYPHHGQWFVAKPFLAGSLEPAAWICMTIGRALGVDVFTDAAPLRMAGAIYALSLFLLLFLYGSALGLVVKTQLRMFCRSAGTPR